MFIYINTISLNRKLLQLTRLSFITFGEFFSFAFFVYSTKTNKLKSKLRIWMEWRKTTAAGHSGELCSGDDFLYCFELLIVLGFAFSIIPGFQSLYKRQSYSVFLYRSSRWRTLYNANGYFPLDIPI